MNRKVLLFRGEGTKRETLGRNVESDLINRGGHTGQEREKGLKKWKEGARHVNFSLLIQFFCPPFNSYFSGRWLIIQYIHGNMDVMEYSELHYYKVVGYSGFYS